MRINYKYLLIALVFGVFGSNLFAQSELVVEWADANGDVKVNALYDTIVSDSLRPADRVYVLKAGGYYWNTERIDNDGWHLRIIGEQADPTDATKNPPVIQMAARDDGTSTDGIIRGQGDITIKNVWITGAFTGTGDQTTYQPFQIDAANSTFIADNVIFDRSNFAMIAFTNGGNDITITNCTFRNLIGRPSTQQWEGRGVSIWADQNSVVFENNTFFNIGMTAIQIESGAAKYVRIVHNTFVNVGRVITQVDWWREAYVANNIVVNGYWHADGKADYTDPSRDPRITNPGLFNISSLPSMYGPEEGRRIYFGHMAAYLAPEFTAYYGDTLRGASFVHNVTKEDFIDKYPNIVVSDTLWEDPGMVTDTKDNYPNMIQNIQDLRGGVSPAHEWFWQLPAYDGQECFECVTWPMTDDFSYTNAKLKTAGTDKLPLGDLNWFPDAKADWETNHDSYVEAIEGLAGPRINYDLVDEAQAEDGTLAGGAEVSVFGGGSWYKVTGGSDISWTVDLAADTDIELKVWSHMNGNGLIGVNWFVNETKIHDAAHGWGEFVWDPASGPFAGNANNEWGWMDVKQADLVEDGAFSLKAGSNTIKIAYAWNAVSIRQIDVYEAGTTNKLFSLTAPTAVSNGATPGGEGVWIPQLFKSVALNGGSSSMAMNATTGGTYVVQAFYQNYSGASSGSILVDGKDVGAIDYKSDADSLGLSTLSSTEFELTAGSHSIGLSGNNVNLDVLQLIRKTVVTGIEDESMPEGYSLSQNYPNPFNPTTMIEFTLAKTANVSLNVYNILGQKVASLLNSEFAAGQHQVNFDASRLSSGVYFYRIEAGNFVANKKMILLK